MDGADSTLPLLMALAATALLLLRMDGTFALIRRWETFLEVSERCNASSRRQYRRALVNFCADTLLELQAVTEDDVVAWLADQPPKGQMRGMTLRAFRTFAQNRSASGVPFANLITGVRYRPRLTRTLGQAKSDPNLRRAAAIL